MLSARESAKQSEAVSLMEVRDMTRGWYDVQRCRPSVVTRELSTSILSSKPERERES